MEMAISDYLVKAIAFLGVLYLAKGVVSSIYNAFYGPLSKLPGPFWSKFTGWPLSISGLRGIAYRKLLGLHEKYGDVIRIVRDRDSIRKVLQEWDLPKYSFYDKFRFDDYVTGLLSERDKVLHRQRRRLVSHGFAVSYLNAQEPLMKECSDVLRKVIDEECQKDPSGRVVIDMWNLLARLAVDIITAAAFGGSFNLVRNKHHPLRSRMIDFFRKCNIYGLFGFLKLIPGSRERRRDPKLHSMLDEILQRRANTGEKLQRKDLLQIFLEAHEKDPRGYTWDHVKVDMLLFLLAGSDTTSGTLSFALLLLVHDDRARKLLVQEIDDAFPGKDDLITSNRVKDLPYLNAVIHETLRLMPPSAIGFPRITDRTVTLNDYMIPAEVNAMFHQGWAASVSQTAVLANIYALQYDPKVWGSDVGLYRPERWLEPGSDKWLRTALFPFSAGTRNCIGQNLAMMELQTVFATLIRHYELSRIPDQDLEARCQIVLGLKAGKYDVGVKQRRLKHLVQAHKI